jgi:erythromycin esterase-like protein
VEWMREYNADADHSVKLHFYGFDSPTEMMYADSPRQALEFVQPESWRINQSPVF